MNLAIPLPETELELTAEIIISIFIYFLRLIYHSFSGELYTHTQNQIGLDL